MRWPLSWLCTVLLALMISACGGGSEPTDDAEAGLAAKNQARADEVIEPDEELVVSEEAPSDFYFRRTREFGDLGEMVERRYIRVLVVHSKTSYFYDRGHPKGITYEALSEFERYLNRKLKTGRLKVQVIFIPVRRDELISDLEAGLGDIAAANLTITPERLRSVDFSDPALDDVKEILVTGPAAAKVTGLDDLAGAEVHVRESSSYYTSLRKLSDSFRKAGKAPIRIVAADENLEDEDILEMVQAGLIGATVVDSHKAQFWARVFDNIQLHPEVAVSQGGAIGWAIRKDCPELKALVNEFVKGHREGTAFGNTVLRRYLRDTRWVKNSLAESEVKKFQATVDIFRKYADQYDFDWLLVAAQAYQESGLDQSARNPTGAVGIMQVLPSTAAGHPINIPDITKLESNIHAGIKILDHYRDQYFDDPGIDSLNQMLMSFAGYNAGPNRINRLRKVAAEEGLDANVWFRNVEMIVAKKVGREPVQYVSNVFKYYVAYRLLRARGEERGGQFGVVRTTK